MFQMQDSETKAPEEKEDMMTKVGNEFSPVARNVRHDIPHVLWRLDRSRDFRNGREDRFSAQLRVNITRGLLFTPSEELH